MRRLPRLKGDCFSCKYTHYSKAIHNLLILKESSAFTVSAANIHIIRKQFTTADYEAWQSQKLFQLQIYTLFESNSQHMATWQGCRADCFSCKYTHYSKAIHNCSEERSMISPLFQLQIYTLFESNSQPVISILGSVGNCFSCKYTHYSKAIHNQMWQPVPPMWLFQLQIYTLFESNSQQDKNNKET